METILHYIAQYGYGAIFVLLMMGIIGLPVPDESLLALAGFLVYNGQLSLIPTLAAAFLGSICGITISYGLGRTTGVYLLQKYGHVVHIAPEQLLRVHRWFARHGPWFLPVGYFVPGVRHLSALVAGSSKLDYPHFALFGYAGGLIWSITFVRPVTCSGNNGNACLRKLSAIEANSQLRQQQSLPRTCFGGDFEETLGARRAFARGSV